MDFFVIVIVMIAIVGAFSKNAKRAERHARKQREHGSNARGRAAAGAGAFGRPSMPSGGWGDFSKMLENMADKYAGEGKSEYQDPPAYAPEPGPPWYDSGTLGEGASYEDEHGRVGGSLPQDVREGEEFPGHEHRVRPADHYAHTQEDPAIARAFGPVTAQQMRAAVVMAEILSPPVSRRRRCMSR